MRMSKPSEVDVLQVANVAGLAAYLGALNPNPPRGVATVHIVVSAAQNAVFLAEGGKVGGPEGRGLGRTGALVLQDQDRLKDWTYAGTVLLQVRMYGIFTIDV